MPDEKHDDAQKGAAGDKKQDAGGTGGEPQVDAKIAEIMKDPDAVQNLLAAKRAANDEAKKLRLRLEEFEKAKKDADDKALQEQGKFKELAEKEKARADASAASYKAQRIAMELRFEAVKAGAVDPDDVVALCDRAAVTISDDLATVTGAKEAVEALKTKKAHLFKAADAGTPPPDTKPPAPRGGFIPGATDFAKASPRDLITRGLEKQK